MHWITTIAEYEEARSILIHPAVLPFHSAHIVSAADVPSLEGHPILLEPNKAMFLFVKHGSMWEVHSSVLPEHRKRSVQYASEMLVQAKAAGCKELWTYVPHSNIPAAALTKKVGLKFAFTRFKDPNWPTEPVDYYSISFQESIP